MKQIVRKHSSAWCVFSPLFSFVQIHLGYEGQPDCFIIIFSIFILLSISQGSQNNLHKSISAIICHYSHCLFTKAAIRLLRLLLLFRRWVVLMISLKRDRAQILLHQVKEKNGFTLTLFLTTTIAGSD